MYLDVLSRVVALLAVVLFLAGCPSKTTRVTGAVKLSGEPTVILPQKVEYDGGFAKLDFDQASELSRRDQTHLFLYFYTEYCGPCKELDKHVFPTPKFQQFARTLVSIKVDAQADNGKAPAARYGVHSYPTMVVCKPGGEEIERFFGFHKTDKYLEFIQDYVSGVNTASDYMKRAMENMADLDLVFQAGRELAIRKRGQEAIPFLRSIVDRRKDVEAAYGPADKRRGNVPRAMLLLARTVYLDQLKERDKALPILENLSKWYPGTYHGADATYMIARIYIERKETDKARDVLTNRVVLKKTDAIHFFRFGNFCLRYAFMLPEGAIRLEEGVSLHPRAGYLWKTLADLYFRQKQYEKAIATMESAVDVDPNSASYKRILKTYENVLQRVRTKK